MKMIIAYVLVTIGIPYVVGMIFGAITTVPISLIVYFSRRGQETSEEAAQARKANPTNWLTRGKIKMEFRDRIAHGSHDILCGIGSVLVTGLIFHWLQTPLQVWVLLILGAWQLSFMVCCNQSYRAFFCSLTGLVIGWFIVLSIFC